MTPTPRRFPGFALAAAIAYAAVLAAHTGIAAGLVIWTVGALLSAAAAISPDRRLTAWPAMVFLGATLLIVALAAELLLPRRLRAIRPASAVAAAAFMVVPTFGVDTITPYHGPNPALAAAVFLVVQRLTEVPAETRLLSLAVRVLEPFALLSVGWLAARQPASDLRWIFELLALPESVAAALLFYRQITQASTAVAMMNPDSSAM